MSAIDWFEIRWLELGAVVLLVAFIVFAFRKGEKVRPRDPDELPEPVDRNAVPWLW